MFLLWGGFAIKKAKDVNKKRHHVLEAAHPSPLVRTPHTQTAPTPARTPHARTRATAHTSLTI